MPLSFLLDENQRGPLWKAIFFHNRTGMNLVDAVRVGRKRPKAGHAVASSAPDFAS